VNTASRMESSGEPMRIHISEGCFNVLMTSQQAWHCEKRGVMNIKVLLYVRCFIIFTINTLQGKGDMTTYWLIGKP
jgi:hypothetical protein